MQLYALEGFLTRLAESPYRDNFVLQGGVLLAAYDLRRPTRDIDLQAEGLHNDEHIVKTAVTEIASRRAADGLTFVTSDVGAAVIRDEDEYPGVRVTLPAELATARLKLQVDINIGDPVWPTPSMSKCRVYSTTSTSRCGATRCTWCTPKGSSPRVNGGPSTHDGATSPTSTCCHASTR
jgi:hypothetical protein